MSKGTIPKEFQTIHAIYGTTMYTFIGKKIITILNQHRSFISPLEKIIDSKPRSLFLIAQSKTSVIVAVITIQSIALLFESLAFVVCRNEHSHSMQSQMIYSSNTQKPSCHHRASHIETTTIAWDIAPA